MRRSVTNRTCTLSVNAEYSNSVFKDSSHPPGRCADMSIYVVIQVHHHPFELTQQFRLYYQQLKREVDLVFTLKKNVPHYEVER